jgi:hypothetical protein
VVEALFEAATNGKQVAVLVELKARFDEESDIGWAKRLEAEGVHVVYGLLGLKTHSKSALVGGKEGERVRRYVDLATITALRPEWPLISASSPVMRTPERTPPTCSVISPGIQPRMTVVNCWWPPSTCARLCLRADGSYAHHHSPGEPVTSSQVTFLSRGGR